MSYAQQPGAGFRRFDGAAAEAARLAVEFRGLPDNYGHGQALAAFKRAASYLDIPPSVVQLIDVMFAWTKPEDWKPGREPIVWPRNEKLARALGLKVRQVQNILDRAIRLGLISHRDSPNGHRGGVRGADGHIKWAYGIVLSPIGTRMEEFQAIAERGAHADERIDALKKRLSAARRRIASLAQTVIDHALSGTKADEELALALSATRQMRNVRDDALLTGCVEQIEGRGRALEVVVAAALRQLEAANEVHETYDIASTDAKDCIHSTTTNQLPTAKAVTGNSSAGRSSRTYAAGSPLPQSDVEDDLAKHGVDPSFIEAVTPELCHGFRYDTRQWGDVIHLAERLVEQNAITRHAWLEACRLMGDRGAAAGVIATVYKYQAGEVRRPGAYLRGMSERASKGELNLGRTFHGFKDQRRTVAMRGMQEGGDPSSVGEIARRALSRSFVLSGRSSY